MTSTLSGPAVFSELKLGICQSLPLLCPFAPVVTCFIWIPSICQSSLICCFPCHRQMIFNFNKPTLMHLMALRYLKASIFLLEPKTNWNSSGLAHVWRWKSSKSLWTYQDFQPISSHCLWCVHVHLHRLYLSNIDTKIKLLKKLLVTFSW